MGEYVIRRGDTFFQLSQKLGGSYEEWLLANPGLNPMSLQIGQVIRIPPLTHGTGEESYREISAIQETTYGRENYDDMEIEVEGVRFRVKRIGESRVPHEIHLNVPRTEIRKIQPYGIHGPCEVQIMLSNVNIIHSPRLMSDPPRNRTGEGSSVTNGAPELSRIGELEGDIRWDSPNN